MSTLSVASSCSTASGSLTAADPVKPKVLVSSGATTTSVSKAGSGEGSADPLTTPRTIFPSGEEARRLLGGSGNSVVTTTGAGGGSPYFPSTAELMMPTSEMIRRANPFDLSFGKANRLLSTVTASSGGFASTAGQSLLEQNGLVPASGAFLSPSQMPYAHMLHALSTPSSMSSTSVAASSSAAATSVASSLKATEALLLKLPSSLGQSPSIFSSLLGTADGNENTLKALQTADFTRLVQQMKESGGLSTQSSMVDGAGGGGTSNAPKTADVLNAVLDMQHSDLSIMGSLNYLNSNASLFNMPTPAGSAPNSAGVLAGLTGPTPQGLAAVLATVASHQGAPLNLLTTQGSANSIAVPRASPAGHSPRIEKLSPKVLLDETSLAHQVASAVASAAAMPSSTSSSAATSQSLLTALSVTDPAAWDPRDVKPVVSGPSSLYESGAEDSSVLAARYNLESMDDVRGPLSHDSEVSSSGGASISQGDMNGSRSSRNGVRAGAGRGRGRTSLTAEMAPDERRLTILERNKAAAVRYRKRKKEEHDEMVSRVHVIEQEKNNLATTCQVLRREVERLNAIIKDREARCHCLRGIPLPAELRERPSGDSEVLEGIQFANGGSSGHSHLLNGMHSLHKHRKNAI